MYQIRKAEQSDAQAIALLHTESSQTAYAHILQQDYLHDVLPGEKHRLWAERLNPDLAPPHQQVLVAANNDGQICGFACMMFDETDPWGSFLNNLHIAPAFHRQGIGRKLLLASISGFPAAFAAKPVHLLVFEDNTKARRVYDRMGGTVSERLLDSAHGPQPVYLLRYTWKDRQHFKDGQL
jgi:ribosomal protein S18 acetylase RimI-like enzyme